jgi:ABC-type nickel/cobalt efflux system permease component RcnA
MSREDRGRTWRRFQAARHITMGLILMGLGYVVVQYRSFGQLELSSATSYTLAGILVIYGLFRIWRGTRELREKNTDDFIS